MGLPTPAVLQEENGFTKDDDSTSGEALSGEIRDDPLINEDEAGLMLEVSARKALECPCLDDLRSGPCGGEFSNAFVCFFKSQQPEKGSDCVEPFEKMQSCMSSNPRKFKSSHHSDLRVSTAGQGHKLPIDDAESKAEDMDEDEDEEEEEAAEPEASGSNPPPDFPKREQAEAAKRSHRSEERAAQPRHQSRLDSAASSDSRHQSAGLHSRSYGRLTSVLED
ncbi:unnamed protein product [Calypogeia fissa]